MVPVYTSVSRLLVAVMISLGAALPARAQRAPAPAAQGAAGAVQGTVATDNGQNELIPLGGAVVSLSDGAREVGRLLSNGDGTFRFDNIAPGQYRLTASIEGFDPVSASLSLAAGQTVDMPLKVRLALVAERVDVVAPDTVLPSVGTLSRSETVETRELEQIAGSGGLQQALRLIASVIEVPGGVAIKGGRPSQVGMQLGPGIFVDPATGLTQGTLPDDAIDSVTVLPNPYAVEFGRFSSGLVVIQTRRAADRWKTRLNNLDPTFRNKRHRVFEVVGLRGFSPRLETGGPLLTNRLYVHHSDQYAYRAYDVPSRPQDEVQSTHRFSSFTRADANLSPHHSLVAVGGFFPSVSKFATLGTFTPPDATVDMHGGVNAAAVTERTLWSDTLFSETTVQMNRYHSEVVPQGFTEMQLFPETTLGNFYNRQNRVTSTYQVVETVSGSAHGRSGLHLFKAGVDVLKSAFDGHSSSAPILIRRPEPDGTLARRIDFGPGGRQSIHSLDLAAFVQDRWQPNSRWYLEFGGRLDRDGVIERFNLTPRVGAAFLLDESGSKVLRSGYGLFFERTPSAAGVFDEFEAQVDTRYAPDGTTPLGAPVVFRQLKAADQRTPRSATWDAAYDHRLNAHWAFHVAAIERRGSHELVVEPISAGALSRIALESAGRSSYREVELGVHFSAGPRADLNASYVRSRARSDLNALTTFFDVVRAPVLGPSEFAAARTDVPYRLFARGRVLPTPTWLLAGVLDWRSGLPYSIVNESLDFATPRNSERFPRYVRVQLAVEHRFKIFKLRPWIGVRADNALNAWLPTDVQANIASPLFRTFYNSEFRDFRLQVRFER